MVRVAVGRRYDMDNRIGRSVSGDPASKKIWSQVRDNIFAGVKKIYDLKNKRREDK